MRQDSWVSLVSAILLSLAGVGCASSASVAPVIPAELSQVPVEPAAIRAENFGAEVHALLGTKQASPATLSRLVSVVRFQLERAARLFAAGHDAAGVKLVDGALLLVRVGELRVEMFHGLEDTLLRTADFKASRGDEGGALAFYTHAQSSLPPGDSRGLELAGHLQALAQWQQATQDPTTIAGLGAARLAAAHRVLGEPSVSALRAALGASARWVSESVVLRRRDETPTTRAELEELNDAERAHGAGGIEVAALFLRSGDAAGAAEALAREPYLDIVSPRLLERLEEAAEGNGEAWSELYAFFKPQSMSPGGQTDDKLAIGAAFGSAIALYRAEPLELRAAMPVAAGLVEYGLGEVMPLVLAEPLAIENAPQQLSSTLKAVAWAISMAEATGELDVARRTYNNSRKVLELARANEAGASIRPRPADIEYLMGAVESRAGNLELAHVHLQNAVAEMPTRDALRLLAAIELQKGDGQAALRSARSMNALAAAEGDVLGRSRAKLAEYDVLRRLGSAEAQAALSQAKTAAQEAVSAASPGAELSYAESTLAEIYERFGDYRAADLATERAVDAARNNEAALAAALQDAARRALAAGNVAGARSVLRRAIDLSLDDEVLLYITLWTQLAEVRAGRGSDGSVAEALQMIQPRTAWVRALRDWARGVVDDATLPQRAATFVQRTEAEFYVVAKNYLKEPTAQGLERLKALSNSAAIELVEVRLARELAASIAASTAQ